MELDKEYKGYERWAEGSKQTVIGDPGDTKEDVIRFMHAHLDYFGIRNRFTFDAARIEQNGNEFIVKIHEFNGYIKFDDFNNFRISSPLIMDEGSKE